MRVLLTGASGFIGLQLLLRLVKDGHQVRALVRRSSDRGGFPPSAELAFGDVRDAAAVLRAVEGCDVVFHAAALVKSWVPRTSDFVEVNVVGLKNVLAAVKATPSITRLIYTSSFFALGPTDGTVGTEEMTHKGDGYCTEYERSKALADSVAMEAAAEGLPIIMLYPGIVYGPGRDTQGNLICKLIRDHMHGQFPGFVGPATKLSSYVYVEDVVEGHILALERGRNGQRYLLVGPSNDSMLEVMRVASEVLGRPAPALHIPLWAAKLVGLLQVLWAMLTGLTPLITPQAVKAFTHDWAYTCAKAELELGYKPRPLRQGIEETIAWLQQQEQQQKGRSAS